MLSPTGLLATLIGLTGCVIPYPLAQQSPDGGQSLGILGGMPPLGVVRVLNRGDGISFSLEIQSDSANLGGRLFLQVDENCCDLDVENPDKTRFLQNATEIVAGEQGPYRMTFSTAAPCVQVPPKTLLFVVPVVTTGGFQDGPTGTRPEGLGIVDKNHYWTVRCP